MIDPKSFFMKLCFLESWFSDETLKAIGWTLLHSLWIGLFAAIISAIIIISTRRSTARLRYDLLMGVMFLFLLSCVFTFFIQIQTSGLSLTEPQKANSDIGFSDFSPREEVFITQKGFINEFTQYFNANANILVLIWLIFFLLHCIKLVTGLGGIQRLRTHKTSLPADAWKTKLNELSDKLGIRQSVTLLQSELIKIPVAIGFFKPVILVPFSLLSNLPPDQVEAILLHELAHVRRRDYLMNMLQRFAEAIFFFNPSFIWLCSLIRQEREACCDDIVVATTGQKKNYLEALVSFQEFALTSTGYAMAIKSKQHYLLNRVKRLLTQENKKLNAMEKLLLLFGLIVFTAFTIIPQKEESKKKQVTNAVRVDQPLASKIQKPGSVKLTVNQLRDTVPAKQGDFKKISTNVNIEGNTKTETITAFDPTGKKYTIVRLNDKLTSLQIDDKIIPENEMGNYASEINQIDKAREKNKERKIKEMEARKAENEKRKIEQQDKIKANDVIVMKNKSPKEAKEVIEKMIETKRKELDGERKGLDQKRKEYSDVKKDITIKKQELRSKEGKEKEEGLNEIKNKESAMEGKLKDIEHTKKLIENKKQLIGDDKEKLEKIKEKENKAKEKGDGKGDGKGNGKGDGEGDGKGDGKGDGEQPNSKKLFKENNIALKQEARISVNKQIFKPNSHFQKIEKYNSVAFTPDFKTAPGRPTEPSKQLFKKLENKIAPERIKNQRTEVPRKEK